MAVMAQDILSSSRSLRRAARLLATTALTAPFLAFPATAQNLPTGASVAAGQVSIAQPSATQMTITQSSSSAVVNYGSFSIGAGHAVNIAQPSVNAALLNRVTGDTPSTIAGSLTANGHVYLVNPNGIAITPSGTVNVGGGFVASTLGISDDDFMSGKRTFAGNGASSQVSNAGTIRVGRGGYAALIGGTVNNSGSIEVPLGKVALGSGERATLDFAGDGFLQVAAPTKSGGTDALIKHSGSIRADGGSVIISAATAREAARNAINLSGHVQARSISGRSGSITIGGGAGGAVNISGHLSVASRKSRHPSKGGTVTVTGRDIVLQGATINASGKASGGTVKIGGDWQGTGDLQHAETTTVDAATIIKADATASGNGGTVVVWSDKATSFAGTITARGGSAGGNGGNTEVSGKALLDYTGFADLSATNGAFGTLLLDPYNVIISGGADSNHSGFAASGNDSIINVGTLQTALAGANVTVSTGAGGAQAGDITVAAPVTWSSGTMLTFDAWHSIAINAPITIAGTGGLALVTNNGGSGGTLSFAGGVQYTGTPNSGQSLTINGQSYELLYSMADLQGINTDARLSGSYALAKSLDATGVAGWVPLGTDGAGTLSNAGHGFAGSFTGLGNAISNLDIDIGGANYAGLFGYSSGAVSDIGLLGGTMAGGSFVGGLVGVNHGSITRAYATGLVSGINSVGGLVGASYGSVSQAYATGTVSSSSGYSVGGLAGSNYGSISQAYATGEVSGGAGYVGGLVGYNDRTGNISQAYATGAVSGSSDVGGLVGYNFEGSISEAYATGAVTGGSNVGGLVGRDSAGSITTSYFDSYSTGQDASNGVGNIANASGVTAVTSDPAQAAAGNYAYKASAYSDLTLTTTPGGSGWYMIDGQTRPFGAWEYSQSISNSHQLQLVNMDLNASYSLARSIDLAGEFGRAGVTTPPAAQSAGMWNRGFVPLGTDGAGNVQNGGHGFAGSFTGLGNTISDLTVDIGGAAFAGLFGLSSGAISNIGLIGGSVNGYAAVGGLVGANDSGGSIAQAFATGAVSGSSGSTAVGGLVGLNVGNIMQAYAAGAVSGSYDVGGLVGFNYGGGIAEAHATGGVSGDGSVGGLVGANDAGGSIMHAYATGAVSGASGFQGVGGLVGLNNSGDITQAYATGTVSGDGSVGGLVGINNSDGRITESHASGTVGGSVDVGGLVGFNTGTITQANATGAVTGFLGVGGLVGINAGSITQAYASGAVGGSSGLGGLIGINNSGGGISQSYASGAVSGSYELGGLVGFNDSGTSITQSYATGAVSGSVEVGGLVGANAGSITEAHATGTVSGDGSVGGLVGLNNGGGISEAYASGAVSGSVDVGGLVGSNYGGGISQAYATGTVSGASGSVDVGGLVGANDASGSITQAYATGAVSGASGSSGLGGLVGINAGSISQASATGAVSGTGNSNGLGGLVGINSSGSITQAYATGAISGASEVGGLVGFNNSGSSITQTYATGVVSGSSEVGGLVGANAGNITQAYATGAVSGSGSVGGLVGLNNSGGSIAQAYATGTVSGAFDAGGLVGFNHGGNITQAYASGAVSGTLTVGGLVGGNDAGGSISQAYATGAVSGSLLVGGLVGLNSGGGSISQTYATGAVGGGSSVGGLVGLNDSSGSITQTYATGAVSGSSEVGGLVGFNNSGGSIASSYFDRDTTGQTLGVGSGSPTGVTALSSMDGSAFDKASYVGFDWTVWSPPSAATGGAPAYYPELFGVSGVVGVDYGSQTITYGDTIPSFGAPFAIYGIGYFNTWTTAPGVGSVAGANAGIYAIEATGAAANFTPGGASRVVGIGTLTIEPAALMDPGLWADRVVFDSFYPVSLPDNARPVSGAPDVVTPLGVGVFYADPRFETVFVCFGGGHGTAQSCFEANR